MRIFFYFLSTLRHVLIFELNMTRQRHKKVAEVSLPSAAQFLSVFNERLCVGFTSGFALYSLQGGGPISESVRLNREL